ncbi:MAG: lipocalin-like domain-containing protein [Opitutales bacterium]
MPYPLHAHPLTTEEGFAVPQPGVELEFPRSHAAHPDYAIEWWYLVGHLQAKDGERFGFQATFFRNAGPSPLQRAANAEPGSSFGRQQLHLAHFALSALDRGTFIHEERMNRDGWAASASDSFLSVRNGNWKLWQNREAWQEANQEVFELDAVLNDRAALRLSLRSEKPRVRFGENGLSYKGAEPGAVSYYITYTRLNAEGVVTLDGEPLALSGIAWMDHEISSNQLGAELSGWDWTAIQLNDGREIKAYRLRLEAGGISPFSALYWIDEAGGTTLRTVDQFTWKPLEYWTSEASGARYPTRVEITTVDPRTNARIAFELRPLLKDQEIRGRVGGIAYWEGACEVYDARNQKIGQAYLELTGYEKSLSESL